MINFLIRVLVNAAAIALTASLLPGFKVTDMSFGSLLIIGLIFGIVNALIKPILVFLTCPMVIVTLGLFILVINGVLLLMTDWLVGDRLNIDGFGWAILGGVILGVVSMLIEIALGIRENRGYRRSERPAINYRRFR